MTRNFVKVASHNKLWVTSCDIFGGRLSTNFNNDLEIIQFEKEYVPISTLDKQKDKIQLNSQMKLENVRGSWYACESGEEEK